MDKKTDIEVIRFAFNQCEKYLDETLKTSDVVTNRTYNLIQIFTVLGAGCLAHLGTNSQLNFELPLTILSILGLGISFYILFKGIIIYNLRPIRTLGNVPDVYLKTDFSKIVQQENELLLAEIDSIKESIRENREQNENRSNDLKHLIAVTKWSLVAAAIAVLLFYLRCPC